MRGTVVVTQDYGSAAPAGQLDGNTQQRRGFIDRSLIEQPYYYLVAGVILLNLVIALWGWYSLRQSYLQFERQAEATTQTLVRLLDQSISDSSEDVNRTLKELVGDLEAQLQRGSLDGKRTKLLLEKYHSWIPDVYAIRIVGANGIVLWGTDYDAQSRVDLSDRDHFIQQRDHTDAGLFVGKTIPGRITKGWLVPMTRRFSKPDGSFAGTVVASVHTDYFNRLLAGLDVGAHGVALLRAADTGLIARHPAIDGPSGQVGAKGFSKELAEIIISDKTGATLHSKNTADGMERIFSYRRLKPLPFHLVVGLGAEDYLRPWYDEVRTASILGGAFALGSTLLAWMLWRVLRMHRIQQQRLTGILEGTNVGTWEWNVQTGELALNERWAEIVGYQLEELAPVSIETWTRLAHPDDLKQSDQLLQQHFAGASPYYETEARMRHKDGHWVWVQDRGRVSSRTPDGKPQLMSGTHQDIGERKLAESLLRDGEQRFRDYSAASSDWFWEMDAELRFSFFSENAQGALGVPPLRLLGRRRDEIAATDTINTAEKWEQHLSDLRRHLPFRNFEYKVLNEFGGRWFSISGVPCFDQSGSFLGYRGTGSDVTARKQTEAQLSEAVAAAQAASMTKSRFLATMSHEIRTPMNGILGMAQMLLQPKLQEAERLDFTRTLFNSGQTLLTLLNDILDFSKVEAGKLELESTVFEPGQIIHETHMLFTELAEHKGLRLESVWLGPSRQRYLSDSHRLRQMLSNLLGNAVKFTERGHVRLEAKEVGRDEDKAVLEFSVSDTGIGIAEDKQKNLFQPFSQADSSTTRQYGGTGLGLSIVRSLARLMDGDVSLESRIGRGSIFRLRISAGLVAMGEDTRQRQRPGFAAADNLPASLAGRVLVVEDNQTNRKVIEAMLNNLGLRVALAEDGLQGVEAITGGQVPDLILMDIQMPILDGYAATTRIRKWEQEQARSRIPIVALTADAYEEDRQRCLAAGMDDFIAKPIDIKRLPRVLAKWLPAPKPLDSANDPLRQTASAGATGEALIFDEVLMLSQFGDDPKLAKLIIESAMQDLPKYFDNLEQAIAALDWKNAQRSTHTMKGLTAQIGGTRLSQRLKAVDDGLKLGETLDIDGLTSLRGEYHALVEALHAWL